MDVEHLEVELREDYMVFWHTRWISYPFLLGFIFFFFLFSSFFS